MQLVGFASGISSASALPEHQAGDLIFCWAFRDGNTGAPTLPSGWTSHSTQAGSSCGARLSYLVAIGPGTAPGTFTNATSVIYIIFRADPGSTLAIGTSASASGTTSAFNYPGLPSMSATARKRVLAFAGHRQTNTNLEAPVAGMAVIANVVDGVDEAVVQWSEEVTSWGVASTTLSGTASGWLSRMLELRESGPPTIITAPTIAGDNAVGGTLTLTDGAYGENGGGAVSLARQWARGSTDIPDQTGSTYTKTNDDVGQSITARVTASNASGPTPATSNAIGPIVAPGGGGDGLWTPADLAVPPYAWWDVRDTATLTIVDGRVTMIADKSGNGRHLIGRRAAPEYLATGMPTAMPSARIGPNVYPDGTYGGYSTDIGADFGLDGGNFSAFAAFRQPYLADQGWYQTMGLQLANYANMVPWEYRGSVSRNTIYVMYWPEGSTAVRGFAQYDGWDAIGWSGGHGTEYVLADYYTDSVSFNSLISNGSAMLHHLNGTLRESVDIEAPIAITCVGYGESVRHQYQPGVLGDTDVGEGVILAYQASLDERQRLEGYFAWGWGSENRLPADHPYRNAPPASEAGHGPITGSLSVTEQPDAISSTGRLRISGGATVTDGHDAVLSSARLRLLGNLVATEGADTLASSGRGSIRANLSFADAADTLATQARVSIRGSLSVTEAGDALAATSSFRSSAGATITEVDDTFMAFGRVAVVCSASITEGGDEVVAVARLPIRATALIAEAEDSLSSAAGLPLRSSFAVNEAGDTLNAYGLLASTGSVAIADQADGVVSLVRLAIAGSASLIEQGDIIASASSGSAIAVADVAEADDGAAAVARLSILAAFTGQEAGDVVFTAGAVAVRAAIVAGEAPDSISSVGRLIGAGEVDVSEQSDGVAGFASVYIRATFAVVEASDSLVSRSSSSSGGNAWIVEADEVLAARGRLAVAGSALLGEGNDVVDVAGVLATAGTLVSSDADDVFQARLQSNIALSASMLEGGDRLSSAVSLALYARLDAIEDRDVLHAMAGTSIDRKVIVISGLVVNAATIDAWLQAPVVIGTSITSTSTIEVEL